jgi:chromate transporter
MSDDENLLWPLAKTFALVSMLAIGGANAVVPEIHRQVVLEARWMDEATFAQLFAISQAAPGPNVLIVSVVGWQVAGVLGLMVATLAMLAPSSVLAFVAGRLVSRVSGSPWYKLAEEALVPVSIGLIAASGLIMADAAVRHWLLGGVAAASAAFVFFTNRNPLWAIVVGMAAGAVLAL